MPVEPSGQIGLGTFHPVLGIPYASCTHLDEAGRAACAYGLQSAFPTSILGVELWQQVVLARCLCHRLPTLDRDQASARLAMRRADGARPLRVRR